MKQILAVYPNILVDYKKWTKTEFIEKLKEQRSKSQDRRTSCCLAVLTNELIC